MTDTQSRTQGQTPSHEFIEQVKDALEHLYDLSCLQHHPLVERMGLADAPSANIASQQLRRELVNAIETLNPGEDVPFQAPHARLYNLLVLRYLENLTVREAAREVGVSLRQAHRNLRHGERSVAEVLWARFPSTPPQETAAAQRFSLQAEIARLEAHAVPTDLRPLLQNALKTIEPLATKHHVVFHIESPEQPAILSTSPMIAEQVLVNMLSHAVGQAKLGALRVTLAAEGEKISLALRYAPRPELAESPAADLVVSQLVQQLRWQMMQEDLPAGDRIITLNLRTQRPTILVIDDNEGIIDLLQHYLADVACEIIAAADGQEGLRLAQERLPHAIVLDVMIPGMHGWEVLQRIRNHPKTAKIPVIVCSVIGNPELAQALEASLFLPKPINREDILAALHELNVV